MRVLLSPQAARAIFAEVRRWVERGLQSTGVPLESMLYPLAAMVPRSEREPVTPLELVGAEGIAELVIDAAAIPPDAVKEFSPHNCHFSAGDIDRANHAFNAAIDEMLQVRPRLAVLSKLHTHPFPGGAFLSGGDLYHGVTSPKALTWRQRRGLDTALLHVVYPDRDPVITRRPWRLHRWGARGGGVSWRIHSWASTTDGQLHALGDAEVIPSRHASVAATRRLPYWAARSGASWCDRQKASLRSAGYRVSRNLLGRGWRRYLVELADGRQVVVGLPPDLPRLAPRALLVVNAARNQFEPLPLPVDLTPPSLPRLSLLQLVRHVERA